EHLHPELEGELVYDGRLFTDHLELRLAPLAVVLSGSLGDDFDLAAEIQPLHCAEALAALRPVVPALDGMLLDGELAGTVEARGRGRSVDELRFDLDVGCRVKKDAPLADLAHLELPVAVPLDSLPPAVVRAFVAAEDGNFFRHHG